MKIQSAEFRIILILSLIFLFVTFVLILFRKSRIIRYDFLLMSFVDKMSVDSEEEDQGLLKLWDKTNKKLGIIRLFVYLTLSVGIGLQVLFIVLNYNSLS